MLTHILIALLAGLAGYLLGFLTACIFAAGRDAEIGAPQ